MPSNEQDAAAPDENIPLQGTHRSETDDALTSSVRAQAPPPPAPKATPVEEGAADNTSTSGAEEEVSGSEGGNDEDGDPLNNYRLSHDPASGRHRVSLRAPSEDHGGDFREISQHTSRKDLSDALGERLGDGPRFIVLENVDTGEVYVGRGSELEGDLFTDDRFDQATVFDREEDAAAYAEDRRSD